MRCIVIDDEHLACTGMELLIQQVPVLQYCRSFSNVLDADTYLKSNPVDLIFLDIQMPVMTGIEYIKAIGPACQFILTTAYSDYALEGFDLNVTDYLVKPVRFERFYKAVHKALARYNHRDTLNMEDSFLRASDNSVFIRADRKFIKINFNDISFIEGSKDYVTLYAPEKIMCAMNLRTILGHLPQNMFMRINKSFIINLSRIKYVNSDYVQVDNEQIPIGDGYKDQLLEYIKSRGLISR